MYANLISILIRVDKVQCLLSRKEAVEILGRIEVQNRLRPTTTKPHYLNVGELLDDNE